MRVAACGRDSHAWVRSRVGNRPRAPCQPLQSTGAAVHQRNVRGCIMRLSRSHITLHLLPPELSKLGSWNGGPRAKLGGRSPLLLRHPGLPSQRTGMPTRTPSPPTPTPHTSKLGWPAQVGELGAVESSPCHDHDHSNPTGPRCRRPAPAFHFARVCKDGEDSPWMPTFW